MSINNALSRLIGNQQFAFSVQNDQWLCQCLGGG
jgi:hypothetical protein